MSVITLEVLLIVLLTLLNGLFAMSELAVVSARKTLLQQWAEAGNRNARRALDVANAPQKFLSTVQVGITLIGVLAGAFGGATIAQQLASAISRSAMLAPYAETLAVGIVVMAITYLSLILGELMPKRIALHNPERIATFMVGPMGILSRIAAPVVWFLGFSTNSLLWLFRMPRASEIPITLDEIRILIQQGTDAGILERDERDVVDRVFRLGDRRVSTIMTPRKNLVVLYVADSPRQLHQKVAETGHSLFPLCEDTLDNVLGVVRTQDLLGQSLAGKLLDLRAVVRQPLYLPESVQSLRLLEQFRETGKDTALLLDEYGGLQGIVTATDVLRALVGQVSSVVPPKATRQPDGSWLVDGMVPLDELKETLSLGPLPNEESHSFVTAGGFVMGLLGRVPSEGETMDWNRYRFEILTMDGLRVDRIRVTQVVG
jgi:putative hemolysin